MGAQSSTTTRQNDSISEQEAGQETQNPERIQGLARLITAESRKRADIKRDNYDFNKENTQVLKRLFKKMDPTVMKMNAGHSYGEIELSFKYEATRELLLVKVIRARDLVAKDLRGKTADPYVKLYLHPDAEGRGDKKTRVSKKTLNPTYHEIFAFPMTDMELSQCRLILQVWDFDIMGQDDFIGEALVDLHVLDFQMHTVLTAWFTLQAETDLHITGDLEISLAYRMPDTLSVTIHRGNNLMDKYQDRKPNPFVKLQVPGIAKVYETEVKESTVNPDWNDTFDFQVQQEEFEDRYVVLHVIDFDHGGQNDSMGQVLIELKNFDPEEGYHGNFELADLKNNDRIRNKRFQHATVQEFRESLVAHAAFRYPKFLFQQHEGTKVIKVTSRKAGAQAKLRTVNGIPVY